MHDRTPEVESIRLAYSGLNNNDIGAFLKILDPQIEWILFVGEPEGGTHQGYEVVKALLEKSRGGWAEGTCEPQEFQLVGDRIVVFARVHVRLKSESEWRDGDIADVFTFRNGKVVQIRTFSDRAEALTWAGAESGAS
ncbi:MAG: nuclear transport factor 2 family protein [Planctomycetes bacterium]|nr:nuclear transport factor 2 family protein [Planctomycetota bacterium]